MQLWVPLLAALFGGVGAQILSVVFSWRRRRREADAVVVTAEIAGAAQVRAELWRELENLRVELRTERERVDALTTRLEESRRSYLELLGQHAALEAEHKTLKAEHAEMQEKYEQVQLQMQALRDAAAQT